MPSNKSEVMADKDKDFRDKEYNMDVVYEISTQTSLQINKYDKAFYIKNIK